MNRRQYLVTAGSAAAGALALQTNTRADGVPELDKPGHVTLSYDEERLEKYQPKMITSAENRPRIRALFGYIAESEEHEMTAYAYWLQLTHQNGLPLTSADSHLGDHEPCYVFVDESGSVETVVYTGYHHYAAELSPGEDALVADRGADPTHLRSLRIVDPWHHYLFDDSTTGSFLTLESWLDVRDEWARNDFYSGTQNAAVDNPYVLLDRDSWWADGTPDARFALLWRAVGLGGAARADETRGSLF